MADNILTKDRADANLDIAAKEIGGVKFPRNVLTDPSGNDITPLTDAALRASPVPVSCADLAALVSALHEEDTPHVSGDMGQLMLAIRSDTDAPTANDGDYTILKMDEEGRLKVSTKPASYAFVSGNITASGQNVSIPCGRFGNISVSMSTSSLAGHNVSFEVSNNSTNGTDGTWYGVQAVRSNANTVETTSGVLAATPSYMWHVNVSEYTYFRVRATAHTSGTASYIIKPGSTATEPIPAIQITGTQPVSFTQPALVAGTAAIGDVGIQYRGNNTGGALIKHIVSAASTNATNVKASSGRIAGWAFVNTTASWQFVKIHNTTTTPTAGSGVVITIGIPPNGVNNMPVGGGSIGISTGISYTIVTGAADSDATATTAGAVVGDLYYA